VFRLDRVEGVYQHLHHCHRWFLATAIRIPKDPAHVIALLDMKVQGATSHTQLVMGHVSVRLALRRVSPVGLKYVVPD